jgi:hypothetical protein
MFVMPMFGMPMWDDDVWDQDEGLRNRLMPLLTFAGN